MICQPCRSAGEMNRAANTLADQGLDNVAVTNANHAKAAHKKCTGGCDCQHRIGRLHVEASRTETAPEEPAAEEVTEDDTGSG